MRYLHEKLNQRRVDKADAPGELTLYRSLLEVGWVLTWSREYEQQQQQQQLKQQQDM